MARLLVFLVIVGQSSAGFAQADPDTHDIPPAVLKQYEAAAEHHILLLGAAYEVDDLVLEALRVEYRVRALLEEQFNELHHSELFLLVEKMELAGGDDASPEGDAVTAKAEWIMANYPTNPRVVARWLEDRLPPEVAKRGRPRIEELWAWDEQQRRVDADDLSRLSQTKKIRFSARRACAALVIPDNGKPIPVGNIGAESRRAVEDMVAATPRIVKPMASLRQRLGGRRGLPHVISWRSATNEGMGLTQNGRSNFPPAIPLDDWDRTLIGLCKEYSFSEARIAAARGILGNVRKRAKEYRLNRADEYAQVGAVMEGARRRAALQELDLAIEGMFQELKQRLDGLATQQ